MKLSDRQRAIQCHVEILKDSLDIAIFLLCSSKIKFSVAIGSSFRFCSVLVRRAYGLFPIMRDRMLIPAIYVDLDDVIAETLRSFARLANSEFAKEVSFEEIFSFDLGRSFTLAPDELQQFMKLAHAREVLVDDVSANPQAIHTLSEWARLGVHITVVTGRPITTYDDTLEWLRKHQVPFHALRFLRKYGHNDLGESHLRPLQLRTLAKANFLFAVEDSLKMAEYLSDRASIPVLLIDKPWNRDTTGFKLNTLVRRCSDWSSIQAVSRLFLQSKQYKAAG